MAARIAILNGVGSVGKTSIARALQAITSEPFLHVAMDAFIDMLPETLQDHRDGFAYETIEVDGHPQVVIRTGPVSERLLRGMRHAIAAMAEEGNNLIVDDVLISDEDSDYRRLLSAFDAVYVGLIAPLEAIEARERRRGDRLIGLARWQYDRVHAGRRYDLELDTSLATAEDCAKMIKARFGL